MRTLLSRSWSRGIAENQASRKRKRESFRRALQIESLETRRVFAAVATDRIDYQPGETVQISASAFHPGEAIRFQVLHTDGTINSSPDHSPWIVVDGSAQDLDQQVNGNVSTQWYVNPDDSLDSTFLLTALGLASNQLSSTTFTDAVATKSSQFENAITGLEYTAGSLNQNNAAYTEGASVPYRYFLADGTENGTLVIDINYHYLHTTSNALDFLTSDNTSENINDANRFGPAPNTYPQNFDLTSPLNSQSIAITDDPSITPDNSYTKSRSFLMASSFPFTVTNVTVPTLGASSEDKFIRITITLGNDGDAITNEGNVDFALFFGAHLASDADYPGSNNGAADIQGAGVHMRIGATLNGASVTSGELTMQPSAIVATNFAWEKRRDDTQQLQGGATFLITPNPLTGNGSMTVVDNGVGDANPIAGQFLFDGPLFGTYLVQEVSSPSGFLIDDNSVRSITVDSANPMPSIGTQGIVDAGNTNTSDFFNIPQTFIALQKVTVDGTAEGDSLTINAGETVTWRYTVTNPSQTSLGSVKVVDSDTTLLPVYQSGDTDTDGLLDPTETWIYIASGTATAGNYINLGTVSGTYTDSSGVSHTSLASDGSGYFGANPQISVNKVTVDGTTEGDGLSILTGESLKWRYVVSAVGNVSLASVGVIDSAGVTPTYVSGDSNTNNRLDVGESWIYEAAGVASTGPYSNTATATGSFTDSASHTVTRSNTDSSSYTGADPQITVDKVVLDGIGSGDNKTILVGESIIWQYTVRNVGNVPLRNVFVNDLPLGAITNYSGDANSNGILETSETWIFTKSGVAVAGTQNNTGTVSGEYTDSAGHVGRDTASDGSGYIGANPQLAIDKITVLDTVSGDNLRVKTGENIKWRYKVTNTGNVPVSAIVVTDSQLGVITGYISGDSNSDGKLDQTETWLYEASGVAISGDYSNTGTATGSYTDSAGHSRNATATDQSNYFGANLQIGIDKVTVDGSQSGDGLLILVGKPIGWRYTVTNLGNVELSNIAVSDSVGGVTTTYQSGDTDLDNKLDTTETWIYTASGMSTFGVYSNVGTASGNYTDSDGHIHGSTDSDISGYFGADPQISIQKVTADGNSKGDGKSILVGESIKWEYTVTNVGNVPLSSVAVTDSASGVNPTYQSGDANGDGKLDSTETWLFQADGTAVKGGYTNTGTARGSYADSAGASRIDFSTDGSSYTGAQTGILMSKVTEYGSASGDGLTVEIGKPISWHYTVLNTGNVPLAFITITDDQGVAPSYLSGDNNGNGLLDTDEIWFYRANGISVAGNYTNIGTVKGSYSDSAGHVSMPSFSDPSSYFGGVPAISIVKTTKDGLINSDNIIILTGEIITWDYIVSNAGTLPVEQVVVTDTQGVTPLYQSGDTNGDSVLDVGEQWLYSASGSAITGPYLNQGIVTGIVNEAGGHVSVSATDASTYFGANPKVAISKVTVDKGLPAQDLFGDGLVLSAGEPIAWRYTLSNTGNVAVKIDSITDSKPGVTPAYISGDTDGDNLLDIDEKWVYEANGIAIVGDYSNTGTVTASFVDNAGHSRTDTASDSSSYFGAQPLISITKATVDGGTTGDGNNILTGETISWNYTVKNIGNVDLRNVHVNDLPLGTITSFTGDSNSNGILESTETWVYTKTGTSLVGWQYNTGTAYGEFIDSSGHRTSHTAADQSSYYGANPQISIDKVTVHNGTKGDNLSVLNGESIEWEYSVKSTGNVSLSEITVSDSQVGVTPVYVSGDGNTNGLLDASETWLFRAIGTAIVGNYSNTGTVSGSFTDTAGHKKDVANADGSSYFGAVPSLKLDKVTFDGPVQGDGLEVLTGENIGWIYTLSNTGNVSISNISVSDSVVGGTVYQSGDANTNGILETTEVWVFTALGTATSGLYNNTGTASGIFRDSSGHNHATTADDVSSYFGAEPGIGISKITVDGPAEGDGLRILVGDSILWRYTVVNLGNVPLSEVGVTDSQIGVSPSYVSGDTDLDGKLDLNEKWIFSATGIAAEGPYANVGTASGSFTDADLAKRIVTNSDFSSYTGANPRINLTKVTSDGSFIGDGINVIAGESLTWKYLVSNAGNVALSGISLVDNVPGIAPQYVSGDTNGNSQLDISETWLYEATGTALVGGHSNIGSVSGSYQDTAGHQGIATSSDGSSYFGADPKISIVKDVVDSPLSGDGLTILVGEAITWRYTVENKGNVALKNISVNDAPLGAITNFTGDSNGNLELDTNEVWVFTKTGVAVNGKQVNVGSVSGDYFDSAGHLKRDTKYDSSNYYGADPQISIEKVTVDGTVSGDNLNILSGETVTWRYNIRNAGNISLANINVTDSASGVIPSYVSGDNNLDGQLQVDEIWIYQATGTAIAGSYANTGFAMGTYADDTGHSRLDSASDTSGYYGASPAIALTKVTFDGGTSGDMLNILVGESIGWRYTVTNAGNVPLGNINVIDSASGVLPTYVSGDTNGNFILESNEAWLYEATGTAVLGDYSNTGTVVGAYFDSASHGRQVQSQDTSSYYGADPRIAVDKQTKDGLAVGDNLTIIHGESLKWLYTVTNAGNIPLSGVKLVDSDISVQPVYLSGDNDGDGLLDTSEKWIYEATSTAGIGSYSNTGTTTAVFTDDAGHRRESTATDSSGYFGADPQIDLEKVTVYKSTSGDGLLIRAGDAVSWEYRVSNSGNIAAVIESMVDNIAGVSPVYQSGDTNSNGLLDTTEHWIYRADGIAVPGDYTNVGTVQGRFIDTAGHVQSLIATDSSSYFGAVPSVSVKKYTNGYDADVAPGPLVPFDSVVTWTFMVTNSGNIPLSNVALVDDNGTPTNPSDDWAPLYISGDSDGDSLLDTTEVWLYRSTGKAIRGQYENWGYVSAKSPFAVLDQQAADVFAKDPSHYFGQPNLVVIAPDKGNTSVPIVRVIDADSGATVSSFPAYETSFLGGVRLATADMDRDGVDEIITAPGRGRLPEIRVFKQNGTELTKFRTLAFGGGYIGGIEVAAGDINGDGYVDLVAVPSGMSTEVRIFLQNPASVDPIPDNPSKSFKVFPTSFLGGADVAVADLGKFGNGGNDPNALDGKSEVVVSSGPGMVSTVYVFDVTGTPTVVDTILPFSSAYKGGVTLDVSRVTGSDIPDLILSAGNTGQSAVEIWNGKTSDSPDVRLQRFATFADQTTVNMPVHSVGIDKTGDGVVDKIIAVQGTNGLSNQVRSFNPNGTSFEILPTLQPGFWNIDSLKTPLSPVTLIVNQPTVGAALMESNQPNPNLLNSIAPGVNPKEPLDVNADGVINALDALITINYMNRRNAFTGNSPIMNYVDGLLTNTDGTMFFMDVNCDRVVSAIDVLRVINFLNSPLASQQSNWISQQLPMTLEQSNEDDLTGEGEDYLPVEFQSDRVEEKETVTSSPNPTSWSWEDVCDSVINEIEEFGNPFEEQLEITLKQLL